MNAVRRTSRGPVLAGMALALLLGFGLARGLQATDDVYSQLDFFNQVFSYVQKLYVDVPDNEKLVKGAIDGMLRTLDPHTVYLPPARAEKMDEDFHGEYSGIGINFEIRDGAIVVIAPLEGTPAYRLGIRAGDRIVEIDHKPVQKTITNEEVFKLLRGRAGTLVEVAIQREDEAEALHFTIERAKIPIESVPYSYMIRPGVGYVRVIRFAQTTGQELEDSIDKLRAQGMKSLLIDLRFNAGGLLNQAVDVLDQLVPANQKLVYTRGRVSQANADYRSSDRPRVAEKLPLVVLIDHGSASASEIVAGAVQDLDRGLVAGTNSFGKGLVQNQIPLGPNGSQGKLLLTIAKYYTPSGRLIQRDYTKFSDRDEYNEEGILQGDAPSDSALATRPKFKTQAGRTVYGGGGIIPDVVIKDASPFTRPQVEMLNKRVFFEFATHYVVRNKSTQWTPALLGRDFALAQQDWTELRKTMEKQKVALTDSIWTADRPFMLRQVRAEIASAALGSQERYRIAIEDDPQLNAALELFPRASRLVASGEPATNGTKKVNRR